MFNYFFLFVNKSEKHFRGTCKNENLKKIILKVLLEKASEKNRFEGLKYKILQKKIV